MYLRLMIAASMTFVLVACNGGGGSASQTSPPPATPTGVIATPKDGYVLLDGNPIPGATGFNIYWSINSGVTPATGTKIYGTVTPQAHTGLTNGTTYFYVVTAVNSNGESAPSSQVSAKPLAVAVTPDPLFIHQWHLLNTSQVAPAGPTATSGEDIKVFPVWGATPVSKGAGVTIAIVDDGLEMAHEDLASNMAANGLSHNYVTGSSDPTNDPSDITSGHGTMCAGIAAARDSNGLGGSGVAPLATLVGYNMLQTQLDSDKADAMVRNATSVYVSSNSWGAPDGTGELTSRTLSWQSAIDTGIKYGRGGNQTTGAIGKGTVYVWAAGNGANRVMGLPVTTACSNGKCSDDSNYDGLANYRGVIAVGAVNAQGIQSSYSESGANLWVSAPGGEYCATNELAITTTDRSGVLGINSGGVAGDYLGIPNYTKCMNGTSSATPTVSGVVALVLASNPNLTWRDVRILLAQTARKNDLQDPGWALTGGIAKYNFNHKYGFGVVDANAAVTTAKTWVNVGPELIYSTPIIPVNVVIADTTSTGILGTPVPSQLNVTSFPTINSIEWVEVTLTINAAPGPIANSFYSGDFDIKLSSPSVTVSHLAVPHYCVADATGSCSSTYSGWVFGDATHLGEVANGIWTLTVSDGILGGAPGTLVSWGLKFYGH